MSSTRIAARLRVPNRHMTNRQKKLFKKILIEQLVMVFAGLLEQDETLYRLTERVSKQSRSDGEKELSMLVIIENNKPIPGGIETNQKLDRILRNQKTLAQMIEEIKDTP